MSGLVLRLLRLLLGPLLGLGGVLRLLRGDRCVPRAPRRGGERLGGGLRVAAALHRELLGGIELLVRHVDGVDLVAELDRLARRCVDLLILLQRAIQLKPERRARRGPHGPVVAERGAGEPQLVRPLDQLQALAVRVDERGHVDPIAVDVGPRHADRQLRRALGRVPSAPHNAESHGMLGVFCLVISLFLRNALLVGPVNAEVIARSPAGRDHDGGKKCDRDGAARGGLLADAGRCRGRRLGGGGKAGRRGSRHGGSRARSHRVDAVGQRCPAVGAKLRALFVLRPAFRAVHRHPFPRFIRLSSSCTKKPAPRCATFRAPRPSLQNIGLLLARMQRKRHLLVPRDSTSAVIFANGPTEAVFFARGPTSAEFFA